MRVLVTRPQPDADRTAAQIAALGHEALVDPLLTVELLQVARVPAGPFAAAAATSANAIRAAAKIAALDSIRALPLYAVGSHTAAEARAAGFKTVIDSDGDAEALARFLCRDIAAPARVLHLAGEARARELGPLLAPCRIEVELLELYRMRTAKEFGLPADVLESGFDAVLHFSPRSAAAFAALAERERLAGRARSLRHFCLSEAVADSLAPLNVRAEIAAQPNEASLLALLNS